MAHCERLWKCRGPCTGFRKTPADDRHSGIWVLCTAGVLPQTEGWFSLARLPTGERNHCQSGLCECGFSVGVSVGCVRVGCVSRGVSEGYVCVRELWVVWMWPSYLIKGFCHSSGVCCELTDPGTRTIRQMSKDFPRNLFLILKVLVTLFSLVYYQFSNKRWNKNDVLLVLAAKCY